MPTDQPKRNVWPMVAGAVLVPVLYLLGMGPVAAAMSRGWVSPTIWLWYVIPWQLVEDYLPRWFWSALEWYVELWIP